MRLKLFLLLGSIIVVHGGNIGMMQMLLGKRPAGAVNIIQVEQNSSSKPQKATQWTELHQLAYDNTLNFALLSNMANGIDTLSTEDIDLRDEYGQTPMWWACRKCNMNAYYLLKLFGSDLHQMDNQNRTLLHAIASSAHRHCVWIGSDLMKHHVSTEVTDILGSTAINDLQRQNHLFNDEMEITRRWTLEYLTNKKQNKKNN